MTWNGNFKIYDKSAFSGGLDMDQFHRELVAATFASATYDYLRGGATQIAVQFDVVPNGADQTLLDSLQAAHPNPAFFQAPEFNPGAPVRWKFQKSFTVNSGNSILSYAQNDNKTYKAVATFEFPGTDAGAAPNSVDMILSGDKPGTVDVRIYDVDNGAVIFEETSLAVTDVVATLMFTGFANLPTGATIWEVQIRKGTAKCRLHSVVIE